MPQKEAWMYYIHAPNLKLTKYQNRKKFTINQHHLEISTSIKLLAQTKMKRS